MRESNCIRENLPFRGKLVVSKTHWRIEFTYDDQPRKLDSTRDYRYCSSTSVVTIEPEEIERIKSAFRASWKKYKLLKDKLGNRRYEDNGPENVSIEVGGPCDGIYYKHPRLSVKSDDDLTRFTDSLILAPVRATELQEILNSLPD